VKRDVILASAENRVNEPGRASPKFANVRLIEDNLPEVLESHIAIDELGACDDCARYLQSLISYYILLEIFSTLA
jgi:hypothetical protein